MDVPSLVLQLAPATSIIDFIHQIPNWPSLSAQEELCKMLTMEHLVRYPPPAKGYKYLFKCIEKDIISLHSNEDSVFDSDDLFSETFMEMMVEAQTSVVDADNSGYLSFKSVLLPGVYVPIKVIQSHNQVGTKVWGAGVFLGELLQYKTNLLAGQIVLELGAGVGITGLLLGRAIPANEQPAKVIMTDFHHEVVDLLAHNVDINVSAQDPCILEADLLDWSTVTSSDYLRYNARIMIVADCTYSESGNVNLVSAFKIFLHTMTSSDNGDNKNTSIKPDLCNADSMSICDKEAYMLSLVALRAPFILIACTVRSPETFAHFNDLIQNDAELRVVDVTDWAASCFPEAPVYFYAEDRSRIKLLCIHLM